MATLRDVLQKIEAVKKTGQITKAMYMVATAKLRGAQGRMESFEPYASKFAEVLGHLESRIQPDFHPLLQKKAQVSKVELLHLSADRGLCGSFNTNSISMAEKWIRDKQSRGIEYSLTTVGKRGKDYFGKRDYNITESYTDVYGNINFSFANTMTSNFIDRYIQDEIDEVYMMYTHFVTVAHQQTTLVRLIPIAPPKKDEQDELDAAAYLYEPSAQGLLIELLPKHISVQILNAFFQNETSEHAARMASMDNASRNCNDMIENLTLAYNKARQAAITAELMDIVGGAEALKGA
ncbi:MAG: ATP synthase F1 subunit gamma [Thermodesulfobacteriota bacterium]|nr:ATP synthase F1 subunit gamma [Thermodesulfobacteriota bacterium]